MEYKQIPLDTFDKSLRPFLTEVSSSALGGSVIACSDDFFASKDNLIKPTPSQSLKGQFGLKGALYDGWESRRHNPSFDWVIILLATPLTHLSHFDIDTSHFSGNEAPASQVFALRLDKPSNSTLDGAQAKWNILLSPSDKRWEEVLPVVKLGPDSRHIFEIGKKGQEGIWNAVMVRMIPDGGMARFRAYGQPIPPTPLNSLPDPSTRPINLLSPLHSARIVACSDANFSPPGNLLLPGRGYDMSDGWETRRSQVGRGKYGLGGALQGKQRCEWVVAKLAGTGCIRWVEVDTAFHPGNYPVACKVEAILSDEELPGESAEWTTIVQNKPLGAHRQHWFDVERAVSPIAVFSHVRLTTYPDGGLKRLRIFGHPLAPESQTSSIVTTIPALPLTPEAFAPYGQVVQGFSFPSSAPKGIHVTIANQGTAYKFHRMAQIEETYPAGLLQNGGVYIASMRAENRLDIKDGTRLAVTTLERHKHTSQTFIPMSKGSAMGIPGLTPGGACVSVVALNGKDDQPDMTTARAFLSTSAQGLSYNAGIWHHSLMTVDGPLDFALIEAASSQIGDGSILDCEKCAPPSPFAFIQIPSYTAIHRQPRESAPLPTSGLDKLSAILPSVPRLNSPLVPIFINPEDFAPYGQLIRPYPDAATRNLDMDIQVSPDGKTTKYARLADVISTYPVETKATTAISVFRATPKVGLERGKVFDIQHMERHVYTSQAFIPMGKGMWKGKGEEALPEGGQMLVIVALNGQDDKPDPSTLKAFIMPSSVGLNYGPGVWHHPTLILDTTLDLACVETQISTGIPEPDPRDCELLTYEDEPFGSVMVPEV